MIINVYKENEIIQTVEGEHNPLIYFLKNKDTIDYTFISNKADKDNNHLVFEFKGSTKALTVDSYFKESIENNYRIEIIEN
jgi:hypothetical protein